jgi:NADH-quinone oxidoreductase subunit M
MAAVFLVLALATLGLPGLNGFVGEYLIMLGTYARSVPLLFLAAAGVVLAAWYTLRFYQRVMNGPPGTHADAEIGGGEMAVLVPLSALAVMIGVYPAPLVSAVNLGVAAVAGLVGGSL